MQRAPHRLAGRCCLITAGPGTQRGGHVSDPAGGPPRRREWRRRLSFRGQHLPRGLPQQQGNQEGRLSWATKAGL